ncbi:MAG TPA: hypothetical protein VFV80_12245 [Geminicoccaceae bacterium]|nr:hypothetical protein [Geminicoccaceae bacterium]
MRSGTKTALAAGLSTAVLGLSGPALADQLDGDWCFPGDGRNLTIQGPSIITPNGSRTTGDYRRHTFTYVIPDGDPGAGAEIYIRQLNDLTMVLRQPDGTEETWKRCEVQTS